MKKYKLILILSTIFSLSIISCQDTQDSSDSSLLSDSISNENSDDISSNTDLSINNSSNSEDSSVIEEKYTVTWKNYDGTILEIDNEVSKGTIPSYDGKIPEKEGNDDVVNVFSGWNPKVSEVVNDTIYTATFAEVKTKNENGYDPTISEDGKIISYGLYPQSFVSDESLTSILNELQPSLDNGWYYYDGNYYVKEIAKTYNNESYTFNNGTQIVNGKEYWFECESITWKILNNNDGKLYLLSEKLLDTTIYFENYEDRIIDGNNVYSNNYNHSNIRKWLNNDFYLNAFTFDNTYIQDALVDNSSDTTDASNNKYTSENTLDKVFLASYQDYLNSSFGFTSSNDITSLRECKTTDYAIAKGAWYNNTNSNLKHNGSYWTRTPSSEYYYCSWIVNSGGYLSEYTVDGKGHSVRPSILIEF